MSKIACQSCGKEWHPLLIDAKDDGTGNFTILHGPCCYGPGYLAEGAPGQHYTVEEWREAMRAHEEAK